MSDVAEANAVEAKTPAKTSHYEASKELVIQSQGAVSVPMPTNFAQMQDFAATMAAAGPMVGKPFRENKGACLAILTQSMRWGMDPYAVSQKAYVAAANGDGPVGYEGQLVAAVVQSIAPLQKRLRCEYLGDGDTRQIKVIGYLKGEDEAFEYLSPPLVKLRPAKNSSGYLKGSQLWETDPDQQLWYYGVRAWSRKWTPDVIMGVYTPDEMQTIGEERRSGAAPISMVDDNEAAQDADFTPIDALLNKGGKENADLKAGAKVDGDGRASEESDKPETKPAKGKAGSKPAAAAADTPQETKGTDDSHTQPLGGEAGLSSNSGPAADETGTDEDADDPDDAALVAGVEARILPGKSLSSRKAVEEHRGALNRIATMGSDELKARAEKILKDWPPR